MAKELTKQELRRPDEFVGFFETKLYQLQNRKKQVFWIVLVALVALGVVGFLQSRTASVNQDAAKEFAKATEKLSDNFSSSAADWQALVTKLDEFLKKYPDSSFIGTANMYKAKAFFSLKKYDESLAAYRIAEKNMKAPFVYLAQEGEGITQMQLKQWEPAKAIFSNLTAKSDNPVKDFHLYNLALIQEQLGKPDEANKTYQSLIENYPTSNYAEQAKIKAPQAAKK